METPFQCPKQLRSGKRARIGCSTAGLLAVGLFKNSFPRIARAVCGIVTAITGYWHNPFGFKFGQRYSVAGQAVLSALGQDRNCGAAFNFFSST
jgi:hypothetical protein